MKFAGILIGSEDPDRLVAYYTKLFGDPGFSDGGFTGWQFGPGWSHSRPHSPADGAHVDCGRRLW